MKSNVLLWVFGLVVIAIIAALIFRGRNEPVSANASKNVPPPAATQPAVPSPGSGGQ